MDNFDDLLSTRRSLEDNPFESPFTNARSASPDPWASYGYEQEENAFEAVKDSSAIKPFQENDNAYTNADENLQPVDGQNHIPQSPGFRESISPESPIVFEGGKDTNEENIVSPPSGTSQSVGRLPLSPTTRSGSLTPQSPSTPKLAPTEPRSSTERHAPLTTEPSKQAQVVSPLDNAATSLDSSFASLALGGESIGGWRDSESVSSAFVNDHTNPSTANVSPTVSTVRTTGETTLVHVSILLLSVTENSFSLRTFQTLRRRMVILSHCTPSPWTTLKRSATRFVLIFYILCIQK